MATTLFLVVNDGDDNFLRFRPSPLSSNRANLPSQEETKVWCAFVETKTRTKKKGSLLFTKSLERVETIGGSLDGGRETAHTFGTLFYRISIGHGTSVRSERAYVTRASNYFLLSLPLPLYRETSIWCKHTNCRFTIPHCIFFFHHHLRHFYTAIEYSLFGPLVVLLFLLLYTSFLPSFLPSRL